MFSFGNAMSRAPIISGIMKLPNAPASSGMITKKIMIEACMREEHVVELGRHLVAQRPSDQSHWPRIGIGFQGQASCQRTASASRPPRIKKISPENRNWMPMIL